MSVYEKIMISLIMFNVISWFAFLRPNSFVIWASLRTEKYTAMAIWYVVWFWTTIVLAGLLTIDILWSVF